MGTDTLKDLISDLSRRVVSEEEAARVQKDLYFKDLSEEQMLDKLKQQREAYQHILGALGSLGGLDRDFIVDNLDVANDLTVGEDRRRRAVHYIIDYVTEHKIKVKGLESAIKDFVIKYIITAETLDKVVADTLDESELIVSALSTAGVREALCAKGFYTKNGIKHYFRKNYKKMCQLTSDEYVNFING